MRSSCLLLLCLKHDTSEVLPDSLEFFFAPLRPPNRNLLFPFRRSMLTEKVNLEGKLKKSAFLNRHRNVFSNQPIPAYPPKYDIFILQLDMTLSFCNDKEVKVSGYCRCNRLK